MCAQTSKEVRPSCSCFDWPSSHSLEFTANRRRGHSLHRARRTRPQNPSQHLQQQQPTCLTSIAPMFSYRSANSMFLATVTPSLVIFGAPKDWSSTALRPLGPNVTCTASAKRSTPVSIAARAATPNLTSFAKPREGWALRRERPRREAVALSMVVGCCFGVLVLWYWGVVGERMCVGIGAVWALVLLWLRKM